MKAEVRIVEAKVLKVTAAAAMAVAVKVEVRMAAVAMVAEASEAAQIEG